MDNAQRIAQLILKQLKGELHGPEAVELNAWITESTTNQRLFEELTDPVTLQPEVMAFYQSKKNILRKVRIAVAAPNVIPLWKKMVAAASIILAIGFGSYLLFFNKSSEPAPITIANDVNAPDKTKAIITLADGRSISVDSLTSFTQGNVKVIKTNDGKIIYSGNASEVVYNTLSNPRGSKVIDMQLADGSHVWLNAGSSVTYPVAFVGSERKVNITGEAYFEATFSPSAGGGKRPFIVTGNGLTVEVLGTHFNVNAYADEENIKVTLLEGSVKVNNTVIKPGQQAQVAEKIKVVNDVDLEAVMAWKNGLFNFSKTEIGEIMRQLERWYDMQVEYPGGKPNITLSGNISRNINASKVLEMLAMSGVHFTIEGNRIIVRP